MKNSLTISLLLILAFSCSKNDFENTDPYLEFDKETYRLNDNFELTIKVYPNETEKTIRFHKDLNNIEISFLPKVEQLGFDQILKERFIEGPRLIGHDNEHIDQYTITKEKPFKKKFLGFISELENKIVFQIPELEIKDKIDKSFLLENPTVLIKGNCRTVHGIEGKPFFPKEIKVLLE
jgi:hypothetical protein